MVLLSAAICNKTGKAILSRQFVEMTRARIEGLLSAFPKLITGGKQQQHTFVETDSVRYVYQPLEKLYVLLITTKASNILEDLETLRLFVRLIPEYCRNLDESDVLDQSFNLLFAFDEVVALGYKESVNLNQIRTYTEMDSHEERLIMAVKKSQEEEASRQMKEKIREMKKPKIGSSSMMSSIGSGFGRSPAASSVPVAVEDNFTKKPVVQSTASRGMKLTPKSKDIDNFLSNLRSEGQAVASDTATQSKVVPQAQTVSHVVHKHPVNLKLEEKVTCAISKDGGVDNFEVCGIVWLHITDSSKCNIIISVDNKDTRPLQFQTHPAVKKPLWQSNNQLCAKTANKPFPADQDTSILRWRYVSTEEEALPISINFWPEFGPMGIDVNVELELNAVALESKLVFKQLMLTIPIPPGTAGQLRMDNYDGQVETKRSAIEWAVPLLDADSPSASLQFNVAGANVPTDALYPVQLSFESSTLMARVAVTKVVTAEDNEDVDFGVEQVLKAESYNVV